MVSEEELNKKTEAIIGRVSDEFDVDEDMVSENVRVMIEEYQIADSEVENAVLSKVADNQGVTKEELLESSEDDYSEEDMEPDEVKIGDIDEADQWVTIEGMIAQLWDVKSDDVAQKGLIADETGRIQFVSWEDSDPETLVEGQHYRLENVVTGYNEVTDYYSVSINSNTDIEFVDKAPVEVSGVAVAMGKDTGLVDVEDEEDEQKVQLRLALDDGDSIHRVHLDEEKTEELTGIDLEEAREIARENFERSDVVEAMGNKVLGRFFKAEVVVEGGLTYMAVESIEQDNDVEDIDELLSRARSMTQGDNHD